MFEYKYEVNLNAKFGVTCIRDVIFSKTDIEENLPKITLEDNNLMHMFSEEKVNNDILYKIYNRFTPSIEVGLELSDFIDKSLSNRTFYSFLAEGILSLVFRDIYNYKLSNGVIDVNDTLSDTHTGVDACMYDLDKEIIVLGEAKFYSTLKGGLNAIIKDFQGKSILNKLDKLKRLSENDEKSYKIVLKNLNKDRYDEITLNEFMNQKIIFAGFVLHGEDKNIEEYIIESHYEEYSISSDMIKNNIEKCLDCNIEKNNIEIILIHLPINDKKELIEKTIKEARKKKELLRCRA